MMLAEPYNGRHRTEPVTYATGEDRSNFQRPGLPWFQNAFGFVRATEDLDLTDTAFEANWTVLLDEGKVRGAYHFLHPAASPAAQARFFVDTVDSRGGFRDGDIFVCDSEISAGAQGQEIMPRHRMPRMRGPLRAGGAMGGTVGELTRTFLDTLAELVGPACPVLIYSYLAMATTQLADCSEYPLYVADYASSPPASVAPWRSWTFWQNADFGGQGGGDTDRFNGSRSALLSWVGSYSWTEAIVAELPTLKLNMKDPVNGVNYIGRAQALTAFIGRKNNLAAAAAVTESGNYDAATRTGIEKIQAFFGLSSDGVCGRDTWRALILA